MEQTTFTEKLVNLLITGGMPSAQGKEAKESGLIIALANDSTPVCASYGSHEKVSCALASIVGQSESIRGVILSVAAAYFAAHPEDPFVAELKKFMQ